MFINEIDYDFLQNLLGIFKSLFHFMVRMAHPRLWDVDVLLLKNGCI